MKYLLIPIAVCFMAALTTACKLDQTATRNPPVASFTVQNNGCTAPCNVAFTNSSDPDGGFAITGFAERSITGWNEVILIKTDANGNVN